MVLFRNIFFRRLRTPPPRAARQTPPLRGLVRRSPFQLRGMTLDVAVCDPIRNTHEGRAMSLKENAEKMGQDVNEQVKELPETLERMSKDAKQITQDLAKKATRLIQERPLEAVIGAFAVGFLIAQVAKSV
jgi:ElaB/YqjD/DUF883 family membrane-anchored ribosome-binding protein